MADNDISRTLDEARRLKASGRLSDAAALLERSLPAEGAARIEPLRELTDIRAKQGGWNDANARIDEALTLADRHNVSQLPLLERRAWIYFRQGRHGEAERIARDVIREVNPEREPALAAAARNILAGVAWQQGRIEAAIDDIARAVVLFAEATDQSGMANAKTNLGVLFLTNGEWDKASAALIESEEIRRSIGWTPGRSSNLLNLGWLEAIQGKRAKAREHLEESLRIATVTGEEYDIAHADLALAYLDFLEDKIDDASRHLDMVLERRDFMDAGDVVQIQWLRALIECNRGGVERGVAMAAEARALAKKSELVESEADSCRALGIAHRCSENFEEAERALMESVELAQRLGDPYRRALALMELAILYERAAGRQPSGVKRWRQEVERQLDEAGHVFRRLGAESDIQRAEQLRMRMAADA